ncbi:hypothetical protein [Natrinema gelatinilyticum]|uniref:hypothetical protein n=1 Tax=Natrinema gelatinilyticum TaxID=2961571 RepID=UPI0020C2D00A|nr:hypothetical protein [Natrinema gelatinilyticum]
MATETILRQRGLHRESLRWVIVRRTCPSLDFEEQASGRGDDELSTVVPGETIGDHGDLVDDALKSTDCREWRGRRAATGSD